MAVVLWLPLLDISFDLQRLGMVIHAPYDLLNWLLHSAGIKGYSYIVYFFIGGGLLVFFIGTYAWLSARAGRKKVADMWIYRFSRHPQYAGWIMWSYGVYLLLLQDDALHEVVHLVDQAPHLLHVPLRPAE